MEYTLIRSSRKTLAVQIKRDGKVIVRANFRTPESRIDVFVAEKSKWIEKHLKDISGKPILPKFTEEEIADFIVSAKRIIPLKAAYFADMIGVSYGRVIVRKERTLWGSCSARGNLNFNCLLVNLPSEVCDYVVIHELCHRKHMNHSQAFWRTVERYCPEYKTCRKWLKTFGEELLLRL